MKKNSAGILVYRKGSEQIEILLGHPGGPFYAKKDLGVWSIPKGEYNENEDALDAAKREFEEEIGQDVPSGKYIDLGEAKLSSKNIKVWAVEGNLDNATAKSNTFKMEWPPKSGKQQEFPEIDKVEWFALDKVTEKINQGQTIFIVRLAEKLHIEEPKQQLLS